MPVFCALRYKVLCAIKLGYVELNTALHTVHLWARGAESNIPHIILTYRRFHGLALRLMGWNRLNMQKALLQVGIDL